MTPIFLSFELSKMAAERGFDWEVADYFSLGETGLTRIAAPTPFQLIEWLWEKHEIFVSYSLLGDLRLGAEVVWNVDIPSSEFLMDFKTLPEALRAALELVPVAEKI